jgi:hypothetical protein
MVAMSKSLTVCILTLVLGAIADANAASVAKVTCIGSLTNTRENGVTLGDCDLNFITMKEKTEVEDTCGIPGTIDTPAENQCRIRAVVSPDPILTPSHRKLYKVIEVWSVDKRWDEVKMPYTVSSDTFGLAIGPVSESANDVREALNKARQMYDTGLVNVCIRDEAGRSIDGDELLSCITGNKKITEDLRSV